MIDWTDLENAAKATVSVGVSLKKLKGLFKNRKLLNDVDTLKMFVLTVTALEANNDSIKHLFKFNSLMAKYVEAKQAEAASFLTMVQDHGNMLVELDERTKRMTRRVKKSEDKGKRGRRKG